MYHIPSLERFLAAALPELASEGDPGSAITQPDRARA